jgi:Transglycosylase SLT domain
MRDAVRRLFSVRPPTRIVQVRVPSIIAGRRGLPVLLSAFAVVAAASTAATTSVAVQQDVTPPAGTTMLPQAAPSYSYPGSGEAGAGTPGAATPPAGTGLNGRSAAAVTAELAANGIPARAAQAYRKAAAAAGCGMPWTLVAAIGRVESDHGRFGGATLLADGRSAPPILGIPLDGRPGVAMIRDTDRGRWDRDTAYDRAVGPMQFIPGTWAMFGVDGDNNGTIDPFDIDDAAASAAEYLCKAGGDLSSEANQRNAVYSYNRSTAYVDAVMALAALYAGHAPADSPAPPIAPPTLPPGSVGDPPAASIRTTPAPTPGPTTPTSTANPSGSSSPSGPTNPSSPAPTTTSSSPAPTTTPTTPAPSSPSPSPSPTCTPSPSSPTPTPSSSGTNTPNGTAATPAGSATGTADASGSADATGTTSPAATSTPTPSPTLPPCPS